MNLLKIMLAAVLVLDAALVMTTTVNMSSDMQSSSIGYSTDANGNVLVTTER